MKFVKYLTVAVTVLALSVICAVCAAAADGIIASDGYYEYRFEDDGTATIVKYVGNDIKADVPAKIGGRNVGRVENIFNGNEKIITVTIADGIPELADNIFSSCSSLTSVKLPSTLKTVPNGAFAYCPKLTSITIPTGITGIGEKAFYWCDALSTVNMPTKLDYIGKQAFYACKSLKSISIPTGVKTIEMQTFASCMFLQKVTLPSTVTTIDQGAFQMCLSLSSVNLPADLTEISSYAFYFCDVLNNITIPSRVKSIGGYAFADCASLSKMNIPASTVYIEDNAFIRCGKLASITVASGNTAFCNENGALYTKDMEKLIIYPAKRAGISFKVSDKTYFIKPYAFYKAENLTSVTLPAKLYSINECAFYGCTGIKTVTIPKSVLLIGEKAFGFYHKINVTADQRVDGFKIRGYKRSAAQIYAENNDIKFEVMADVPAAVTGLKARTVSSTYITLGWNLNLTVDGYEIQQYKDGKWVKTAVVTGANNTSYTVKGLKAGTAGYKFRVRGYSGTVNGAFSSELSVNTNPYGVGGFKVKSKSSTSVTLQWNKGTTASGYQLQQYKNGKWTDIFTPSKATSTSYTVKGLKAGTAGYRFRIRAYKTYGSSKQYGSWSSELKVNTNPYGVGGFKVKSKSKTSITLQWNKGTTASGYQLQQYKNGKWTDIFTPSKATSTSYTVKGLKAGTAGYRFRIRAYKTYGSSKQYGSWSSELKVNTNPYGVGGFKVKSKSKTSITLQWNKGTTASGYQLQQYKNGKWVTISSPNKATSTSYTVKSLKANTSYKFRIRAYKTYGNTKQYGSWSKELTAKTSR